MIIKALALAVFSISAFGASAGVSDDNSAANLAVEVETGAATAKLVSIYNDRSSGYNDLELLVDAQGAVQGAKYVGHGSGAAAAKSFTNSEISSGAILEEQQGVKALILTGKVDSASGQGKWTIKYIANGLSGAYKSCDMKVQRAAQGDWIGVNAYTGATLDKAKIITWSMGITTIEGICP